MDMLGIVLIIIVVMVIGSVFLEIGKEKEHQEKMQNEVNEYFEKQERFYEDNEIDDEYFDDEIDAYHSEYEFLCKYIDLGLPEEELNEESNDYEEYKFWKNLWVFQYDKDSHYWMVIPIIDLIHIERKKLKEKVQSDFKIILIGFDVNKLKKRGFEFLKKNKLEFDENNKIEKKKSK